MTVARRGGLFGLLFRLAIIGIGLSLPTWLYLAELRPRFLIREREADYRAAAAACDQAARSIEMVSDALDQISLTHVNVLERSFEVGRLSCQSYAEFREYLLAEGVSQHSLAALHLSATSDPSYPDLHRLATNPENLDARLRVVSQTFGLAPLRLKPYVLDAKFLLGERLFHDAKLSGYRNRSCATCHKAEFGMADAFGLEQRLAVTPEYLSEVPARNVPDLWNRDHSNVSALLWDGRLEAVATDIDRFRLPEPLAVAGFENLMAIQSVRPIFTPMEMLGEPGAVNDLAPLAEAELSPLLVLDRLSRRLFDDEQSGTSERDAYRDLFRSSYGVTELDQLQPAHFGNALAHYIEIEFQSRDTPWDRYLAGDLSAMTSDQKRGALLFFGIGRCAVCHSGDIFSDFTFHSVGVPDERSEKDLGRFYATGHAGDRFLFRTPPLRNVTLTGPYFHNGQAADLEEAIKQHLYPFRYARSYTEGGEHLMGLDEIEAISPILAAPNTITDDQVRLLKAFLGSLEDSKALDRAR